MNAPHVNPTAVRLTGASLRLPSSFSAMLGVKLETLRAVFDDLTFEVIQHRSRHG